MKQTLYINVIFSIVITLILLVMGISYVQIGKFFTANDWVNHTYKVMSTTDAVLADIVDAESVTRGYLITGDIKFTINYELKIAKIWRDFSDLKKLTADNEQQVQRLSELEPLIIDKINTMKGAIEYKKANKFQTVEANSWVFHGQQVSMQIKFMAKDVYQTEELLLQAREEDTLRRFNISVLLAGIVTIVNIFFLIAIIVYLNRLLSKLHRSNINLEFQAKYMTMLNNMNTLLSGSDNIEETMQILSGHLKLLLPFCSGVIYLIKSSANYLESIAIWNELTFHAAVFSPSQCWALRQGKVHEYYYNEANVCCEHNENAKTSISYMCVPLLAHNDVIGVLYLELIKANDQSHKDIKQTVSKNKLLIQNLAGQIALSISSIKMHDVLKTRSTRDGLTNLYNRSYLTDTLARDIERAKRGDIVMAVVMMDIDLFKNVNDTFGHDAGDAILKQISALLTEMTRRSDIVCRYGGEEFLIVFYDTTLEKTVSRIEQMRQSISELRFNFNNEKYSPTASFGIAMYLGHGDEDPDKLIKAADEALYKSKHDGRNRVTVYNK
jgi:diguanylate cyclase (GGDEF)-like protein